MTAEEMELQAAQDRYAAARQKVGEQEDLRLQQAAADVAAYKEAQAKEISDRAQNIAMIEAKYAAKKKREEEAIIAAERSRQAQERALEQEYNRQSEAAAARKAVQDELKRLDTLAFEAERQAKQMAEDLARGKPQVSLADAVESQDELNPTLHNLLFRRPQEENRQVYEAGFVGQGPLPYQQEHPQKHGVDQGSVTELLDRWSKATRYSTRPDVISKMIEDHGYPTVSAAIDEMIKQVGEPPVRVGIGAQIGMVESILASKGQSAA
jgi:hypothetical protein